MDDHTQFVENVLQPHSVLEVNLPYSRVCGRIKGYQFGVTSGFYGSAIGNQGIDGYYIDGLSLTH